MGLRPLQLGAIPPQRLHYARSRLELLVLRNIALQQGDRQAPGTAGKASAIHLRHRRQRQDQQRGHPLPWPAGKRLGNGHGQPRTQGAQPIGTDPRRITRQQAVHVRITGGAPAKTGQPDTSRHFGQQPECRKNDSFPRPVDGGQSNKSTTNSGVIQRQHRGEPHDRQRGQYSSKPGIGVHGDKQPPEGTG